MSGLFRFPSQWSDLNSRARTRSWKLTHDTMLRINCCLIKAFSRELRYEIKSVVLRTSEKRAYIDSFPLLESWLSMSESLASCLARVRIQFSWKLSRAYREVNQKFVLHVGQSICLLVFEINTRAIHNGSNGALLKTGCSVVYRHKAKERFKSFQGTRQSTELRSFLVDKVTSPLRKMDREIQ